MSELRPAFEPFVATSEIERTANTVQRVIQAARPLLVKVALLNNHELKSQGWASGWAPTQCDGETQTDVYLNAAYWHPQGYTSTYFTRGPQGEALYISAHLNENDRLERAHIDGHSSIGRFGFHYNRADCQGGLPPPHQMASTNFYLRTGNITNGRGFT